jgi:hypothetical protein
LRLFGSRLLSAELFGGRLLRAQLLHGLGGRRVGWGRSGWAGGVLGC